MSALVAGLRRAGSAHSLSAPKTNASSRSLPPSPSHTPRYVLVYIDLYSVKMLQQRVQSTLFRCFVKLINIFFIL